MNPRGSRQELHSLLPGGTDLPEDVPSEIFELARQTYESRERVDMRALAAQLGIARRTLYRKVRDRNHLLGEIYWYHSRLILAQALRASASLQGADRVVEVYRLFIQAANGPPPLLKMLRDEPENTLRILATKHGPVHGRVVAFMHGLLNLESAQGHFHCDMPLDALAFAIVRIGESFLYAEVLTGDEPDVRFSVNMVGRLLRPRAVGMAA